VCGSNRAQKTHSIRWNKAKRSIDRRSYSSGRETRRIGLADNTSPSHAPVMFVVSEADAAAIRTAFEQRGELSAAVELRRRFPGVLDNVQARECARIIAGWKPLPLRPLRRKKAAPGA